MKRTKEQHADVRNLEIEVIAGELEDLAYDIECISYILTVLREPLFFDNDNQKVSERTGYAIFDLICKYIEGRADAIAELSAQVNRVRKAGEENE